MSASLILKDQSGTHARLVAAFRKAVIRGQQDGGIAAELDPQESRSSRS